jgi:hypothetical protein
MRFNKIRAVTAITILLTVGVASQSLLPLALAQSPQAVGTPNVAVGPQYTTHVYVAPGDFDRFVASLIATFSGTQIQLRCCLKMRGRSKPIPLNEYATLEGPNMLAQLREADGNPSTGPILRGPSGKPANLDNLSKRIVIPTLTRCSVCGIRKDEHAKADHEFSRDAALPEWHGWYSLRRGVATTLAGLTRDGMASKGLLRHTNLGTTTRHYVKDVPENTQNAMHLLETLFNQCATADPSRPN